MASDDRTLYFASSGHAGFGQSDLFVTRRVDDSWLNWTKPVNLGPTINTPLFEASMSIPARGDYIYMSGSGYSLKEVNYGRSDIYRLRIPSDLRPTPTSIVTGVMLGGTVPLEGLVRVERVSDHVEIFSTASDPDGRFTLVLPMNEDYRIIGWASGFKEGSVQIHTERNIQNGVTLKLIPEQSSPIKGNLLEWPPVIYFATGSDDLSERAQSLLRRWLPRLSGAAETTLNVVGHTDDVGEESPNLDLSIRRAERVGRWLADHGVDPDRITTSGRGESAPVAPNDTVRGRAANRRVEITLSTTGG
jgi:outer membrane protein OmpA-like peptidoglycan-associated protein